MGYDEYFIGKLVEELTGPGRLGVTLEWEHRSWVDPQGQQFEETFPAAIIFAEGTSIRTVIRAMELLDGAAQNGWSCDFEIIDRPDGSTRVSLPWD